MNSNRLAFVVLFGLMFCVQADEDSEFEQFKKQILAQQDAYLAQQQQDFQEFKSQIKQKWGYEEPNNQDQMVLYSKDLNEKVVVDYRSREIRVSLTQDTSQDDEAIQRVLLNSLNRPLQTTVDQRMTLGESLGVTPADIGYLQQQIVKSIVIDSKHKDPRYKDIKTRKVSVPTINGINPAFKPNR